MKINLFSFRDVKVGTYGPIQMFQNEAVLKRTMSEHFSAGRSDDLSKYPNDFDCYFLGTFDDDTGQVDGFESPRLVFNCGVLIEEIKLKST